jgi:hypothetical protein
MDAMRSFVLSGAVVLSLASSGCLGTTPDERRAAEIGDDPPHGPTHNAGNDCLVCHDFVVAGTVYLRATDLEGLAGARVVITDAHDRSFEAVTNAAGNFLAEVDGGDGGFRIGGEGDTHVGFTPSFPLRVVVSSGDLEEEMITSIHREGSCNHCHTGEPGTDSVGRIYLERP